MDLRNTNCTVRKGDRVVSDRHGWRRKASAKPRVANSRDRREEGRASRKPGSGFCLFNTLNIGDATLHLSKYRFVLAKLPEQRVVRAPQVSLKKLRPVILKAREAALQLIQLCFFFGAELFGHHRRRSVRTDVMRDLIMVI